MKKSFSFYVFLIICLLNNTKHALSLPDFLGGLLTFLVVFWSLVYFIKIHILFKLNKYVKALDVLLLLFVVYGIHSIMIDNSLYTNSGTFIVSHNFLLVHLLSLLPIYPFYYFSRMGCISVIDLKYSFGLCFFSCLIVSYHTMTTQMFNLSSENVVNNSAYSFLPLVPLLYLTKMSARLKLLCMFMIGVVVVLCMKRGAILILSLLFLFYFFKIISEATSKEMRIVGVFVFFVVLFGVNALASFYEDNIFFQDRVEETLEGKTSGRDNIYTIYWDYFVNQNTGPFIVGNGSFATVAIFGKYAHNDWLEIAINCGMIGLIFFSLYWVVFAREIMKTKDKRLQNTLSGIFVIYFLMTLFSMSITDVEKSASLCIGYCFAMNDLYFLKRKKKYV